MSAYALPGLFPPLPLEQHGGVSTMCNKNDLGWLSKAVLVEDECGRADVQNASVRINTAKIDAEQLIKSITTASAKKSKKKVRKLRRVSALNPLEEPTAQELAMQFELDVNFSGSHYTLLKSFYQVRRLYHDLEQEVQSSKESCLIPDLPSIVEHGCRGNSNHSFSLLSAVLNSYSPALEQWLQEIFHRVADMETVSLTQFLLEPIYDATAHESFVDSRPSPDHGKSSSSLESIAEE